MAMEFTYTYPLRHLRYNRNAFIRTSFTVYQFRSFHSDEFNLNKQKPRSVITTEFFIYQSVTVNYCRQF